MTNKDMIEFINVSLETVRKTYDITDAENLKSTFLLGKISAYENVLRMLEKDEWVIRTSKKEEVEQWN